MTTHREAYLAKCSEREKLLRWKLKEAKQVLRKYKFAQNRKREIYPFPLTEAQIIYIRKMISESKTLICTYRHELNRIKGMDRVVVPKRTFIDNYCGISTKCTRCKCGRLVPDFKNYCSDCGRHILWERVTK